MSKQFEEIKEGMLQAIAHAKGRPVLGTRVHYPKPIDVKELRMGIGMTQEQFAAKFGVSTATLRHWERGDRSPHGPALVLLNVIKHNPKAVIKALSA
jgi:putative transcriptional regulator